MNNHYTLAVIEHTNEHFEALEELVDKLKAQQPLTFHERNSAERSLQIIVEACIGLSKHICKKANKQTLGEASANAIKALELLPSQPITPAELKGAIGMRNAIVHDYLNLDWQLVEAVLIQQNHLKLKSFILAATQNLE
jgi:uncharacterized protein YutE (UPF0331/DUF86 family)